MSDFCRILRECVLCFASWALVTAGISFAGEEMHWYEKASLPLEGKAFTNTPVFFGRIPMSAEGKVPDGIWGMGRQSTGMLVRFRTDAKKISVRWKIANEHPYDIYIPEVGLSGLDVYAYNIHQGWQYVKTLRYLNGDTPGEATFNWNPAEACIIYLPMRSETVDFQIGVPEPCTIEPFPHQEGRDRPVVHYGTSIVHGGCVSAHGLSFTAQVGRALDVPYVNLGFSGAARMELEMADVVASADAALYVIDCVWNMDTGLITSRAEPFLKRLKELKPETPILLAEGCNSKVGRLPANDALYAVYARLKTENPKTWANLHYLPEEDQLLRGDLRQTHDFIHPNDYGSMRMAEGFTAAEAKILGIKRPFTFPGSVCVPTTRHVHYGPHPKQIFNFYRAPGAGVHPVYVFIHGGGWLGGDGIADADLGRQDGMIRNFNSMGISVAVVNYRLRLKLPDPVYDAAYAIQYLRAHASEYGIDKNKIAAGGFSAGATTSLWLACHPDLADPKSADPVRRESSKVNAAIVRGVQASIDPPEVRAWGLGKAIEVHEMIRRAGGFASVKEMDEGYETVKDMYYEFSSSNFVGPDTPPLLVYGGKRESADWIHHTLFSENFCRIAAEKGAKNVTLVLPDKPSPYRNDGEFLKAVFGL